MASAKRSSSGKHEKMDLDFEEPLAVAKSSRADKIFDTIIGHIEDIIMKDEFQRLQEDFMEAHYQVFDDVEENKLVYTEIHNKYTQTIETLLESELNERIPGFCMEEFQKQLVGRRKELDGEVFEILLNFTDFLSFKESVLDYRAAKEGTYRSLDDSLKVSNFKPPGSTVTSASSSQPHLPEADGPAASVVESTPSGFSDHIVDQELCLPVQNMFLRNNSDLDFCVVGSSFKPSNK